jgi:hypothetical protein
VLSRPRRRTISSDQDGSPNGLQRCTLRRSKLSQIVEGQRHTEAAGRFRETYYSPRSHRGSPRSVVSAGMGGNS